jgi:hypothetical protein
MLINAYPPFGQLGECDQNAGQTEHYEEHTSKKFALDWEKKAYPIGYVKHIYNPQTSNAEHIVGLNSDCVPLFVSGNCRGVIDFDDSVV